ncbi:MAG: helix-turn-helix transcriptional regulator [Flavobacteriales bacterium]
METTERTVYRYLDLLAHVGFHISKDEFGKFCIDKGNEMLDLKFTTDEAMFLKTLCLTAGKTNPLRDGVLQKLYYHSDVYKAGVEIHHAYLSTLIERTQQAIAEGKQISLIRYQSLNSNKVSDRLVEPIQFTDDLQVLVAYEPASKENKYFNIERIGDIKVLKTSIKHRSKHEFTPPDVFGFAKKGHPIPVEIRMNMRSMLLLKEAYPASAPFITQGAKKNEFIFKSDVFDLKPVCRFILGTLDDIHHVIGKELNAELKKYAARMARLKS